MKDGSAFALAGIWETWKDEKGVPIRNFAIVTSPVARRALARLFKPHLPETPVLSFLEIPDGKGVEVVAVVGGEQRPTPRHDPLPRERVA